MKENSIKEMQQYKVCFTCILLSDYKYIVYATYPVMVITYSVNKKALFPMLQLIRLIMHSLIPE